MSRDKTSISLSSAASFNAEHSLSPPILRNEPFISWRTRNFVHVLFQNRNSDAQLRDTPTIYELMDRYKTKMLPVPNKSDLEPMVIRPPTRCPSGSSRRSSQNLTGFLRQIDQRPGAHG